MKKAQNAAGMSCICCGSTDNSHGVDKCSLNVKNRLTDKESQELLRRQRQDILDRYDNEEYWDPQIEEDYRQEIGK